MSDKKAFDNPLGAVGMVSKSETSLVIATTSRQDRVFRRDTLWNTIIRPTLKQFIDLLAFYCGQDSDNSLWYNADVLLNPFIFSGIYSAKPPQ